MVKVEKTEDKEKGIIALAFECNSEAEQEVIDAVRVAIMGDHPKRGGYVNSNRLVIEIKVD